MTPLKGRWKWPSWAHSIHEPQKNGSTKKWEPSLSRGSHSNQPPNRSRVTMGPKQSLFLLSMPHVLPASITFTPPLYPQLLTHQLRILRVIPNEHKGVTFGGCPGNERTDPMRTKKPFDLLQKLPLKPSTRAFIREGKDVFTPSAIAVPAAAGP